ncbi:hypothetical protein CBS101457_001403 [Exobasidium rhododendri]|nr:hypothetical protein CBS101457_001403 [Exobasidium rhododendri]
MSAPACGPLRPSLHRGNMSTSSFHLDKASGAKTTQALASYPNSSNATLMSSPTSYQQKNIISSEMSRAESADSHRSLKSKSSRKDLREMQRSASPMVASSASSTKHKYSRSWENDSIDDDARSISSFTCSSAAEFDSKHRDRAEYGNEESSNRQRFLDTIFKKLSQKTGLSQRESRAWAIMNKTKEEAEKKAQLAKTSKIKPHFLDLSSYISPVPSVTTESVTPRPSDIQRFKSTTSATSHCEGTAASANLRPLLRSRRSADTLGESRRLQKEEWSAVALSSIRGAATAESIGSLHGLSIGQIAPTGMSHAMPASGKNTTLSSAPVPNLPDWARTSNRTFHHQHSNAGPANMARVGSHDTAAAAAAAAGTRQFHHRPVDMARATSHDASSLLNRPSRPAVHSPRGVSAPIRGLDPQLKQPQNIPPNLQLYRGKSPRSQVQPMSPLSSQWPRSAGQPLPEDYLSSAAVSPTSSCHHRGSIGSATSDSGASSGMSSVPPTPVSRYMGLPNVPDSFLRCGVAEEVEMTADEEENLLSGLGPYALDVNKRDEKYLYRNEAPVMTIRSGHRTSPHIATIFDTNKSNVSPIRTINSSAFQYLASSSTATGAAQVGKVDEEEGEEGNTTVKSHQILTRPRASTTSSLKSSFKGCNSPSREVLASSTCPISPSRSSSLQKSKGVRTRDSVASTASTSTSISSSSTTSHSESLLSYTKGSPTSTNASPQGSPHSHARTSNSQSNSTKSRKRSQVKAEDWASSIGRRFAKGALHASPRISPAEDFAARYSSEA